MTNGKTSKPISRRGFIETSTVALAGLTIVPSHAVSGLGHRVPSDKLNVAGVGIAGRENRRPRAGLVQRDIGAR